MCVFFIITRGILGAECAGWMSGDKILDLVLYVFSSMWMPISINIMIEKKIGVKRRAICMLIGMLAYVGIMSVNYTEISAIVYFPALLLIVYFGMGRSKGYLLYLPISYMISLVSDYSRITICELLEIDMFDSLKICLCCLVGVTLMVAAISYIARKLVSLGKKIMQVEISKDISILLAFNVALCAFVYLVNSWFLRKMGYSYEVGMLTRIIFVLYALLTVSITLFTLRIVRGQEKIKREEEERKNLMEYTSQVESMYEELRAFKHDYINILVSLSGYIEKGDMKELAQYFDQNIFPTNEKMDQGKYYLQKLSKIQTSAIKGLVSSKLIYAMNAGLDVFVDIVDDVEDISIRTIDLTRILGIYFDNAVEAALETEKKEIKFNVVREPNSVTIVLMNSFVDHGLSVGEMEKQHVSTKGENRGLGLNNVNEILKSYSNINKMTEIRDGYFVQMLMIADNTK